MTREKYESLPLSTLKEVAKTRGLRGISTMKKADLIDLMLEEDEKVSIKEAKEEVKSEKAGTADIEQLDSGRTVNGILEVMDGYGFIRSQNYLPGEEDVYVSPSHARVKPEKRELFEQRHSRELILYDAAARYLKELKASGEEITPKEWRREIDLLTAQKQVDSIDMKAMREELKAVERLRKAADQLARQERDKPRDRGPER